MIKPVKELFWHLPPGLRRGLAPSLMRERYRGFQQRRHPDAKSRFGSTLQPFIDHSCIFIHIPKSAGLAVTNSLFGSVTGNHITLVEYQTMFSHKEFDQFFKFTFVRNPWDRVVSAFHYLKKGGINARDRAWAAEHLSAYKDFDAFASQWLNKRNIRLRAHFRPQYQFICLPGSLEPKVDFIGYFEDLEADYNVVRAKIGTGTALQSRNVTRGRQKDYRQYYSDETRQLVANVYHEDIKLFGYDFHNLSLRKMQDKVP